MKKSIWLLIILVLFLSMALREANKDDQYKHWLKEEVSLLLSEEEKSEFEAIMIPEEKDRFIEKFWAMRDPTPGTEENEFRDEWYQRLDYVNKNFTYGAKKGWRSDMGKVFLFFGSPWRIESAPPGKREAPWGGHQQELGNQVWVYKPMPHLQLFNIFEVVFKEYQWGYDLADETSQIIRRALEIYPKSVIIDTKTKD